MSNIFVSTCGDYIALRVPGIQPNFDIWKSDGSEMWEGERYVELVDKKACYNPRRLYTESFAQPKKIIGSWSNFGRRITNRKNRGEWVEEFEVILHDIATKTSITVRFNTPLKSLSPFFGVRRKKDALVSVSHEI